MYNCGEYNRGYIVIHKIKVLNKRDPFSVLVDWPVSVKVVVALLFYVHGKHLRSCRDGQLT